MTGGLATSGRPMKRSPGWRFLPTEERFRLQFVARGPDDCWEWTGARQTFGYGLLRVDGRLQRAHRYSYERYNGPIPAGLFVLHRCDNPPCVNPNHLFLGTVQDNSDDMCRKGRQAHNATWSKLTDAQVRAIRHEYALGGVSQRAIAARYGVSQMAISRAVRGETYGAV